MKIKWIDIKNFMAIGEARADLEQKGLVLILGENKDDSSQDSNGSGKSSFPDALCWCLYGVTAREETGDDVINRDAGKNCRVAIKIETPDDEFTIIRHRKYGKHKNRLELHSAKAGDLTEGTDKLTQEKVNRIIGASKDVFMAAIYAGQESMADLPKKTDRELKAIVEEAAGIDQIEDAYKLARERLNLAKTEKVSRERDLELAKQRKVETEGDLKTAQESCDGFEVTKAQRLNEIGDQLKAVKAKLTDAQAKLIDPAQVQAWKDESRKLQAAIDNVNQEKVELKRLQVEATQAENYLGKVTVSTTHALETVKSIKSRLTDIENEVGQPCSVCSRPHTQETLASAAEAISQQLADAVTAAKAAIKQKSDAAEASKIASDAVLQFEQSMTDVSAAIVSYREFDAQIKHSETLQKEVEAITAELTRVAQQYRGCKADENPYVTLVDTMKSRLESRIKQIEDIETDLVEREQKIAILEETANVFGPAGVRAHILDNVTPYLNMRTAYYLSILSDGNISATWNTLGATAKGELRENFHIKVESDTGGHNFGSLSGGEKRKVRLACSMALQDLVANRAANPIDLYIADEIDAAIDKSGLERLMTIMHEKAKEVGTVLVISHSDLKSWISNSVTFVKSGGKSTLVGTAL